MANGGSIKENAIRFFRLSSSSSVLSYIIAWTPSFFPDLKLITFHRSLLLISNFTLLMTNARRRYEGGNRSTEYIIDVFHCSIDRRKALH